MSNSCRLGRLLSFETETILFNSIKNLRDDRYRVKAMNLFKHISLLIIDHSVRKGGTSDIIPAKLRVPLTVQIIYFEAPLLLRLQLIECCFEMATIGAVWCEKFDKFETSSVVLDLAVELFITDQVGIWHVPFLAGYQVD